MDSPDITDFQAFRTLYPATPAIPMPDPVVTERFLQRWQDPEPVRAPGVSVLFIRGYLGNWMPGNLVGPARAVEGHILPNAAGATVAENLPGLMSALRDRVPDGPFLLCGHSKGGLEALALLKAEPDLDARCRGVLLSQTPRGESAVLASLLAGRHADSLTFGRRLEESVQRVGLHAIGAARGGRALVEPELQPVIEELDAFEPSCPVWQTASWSSRPTTWLDSFHGRLSEVRPGCAHDGQFFLEDLVWPGLPHVLLAHVDHAQPVVGGFGFDHVRYWQVLIEVFLANA